jgi:hypothetical protein
VHEVLPHLLAEQFRAPAEVLGDVVDVVDVVDVRSTVLGAKFRRPISSIMRFLSGVIGGSFRLGE